MLRLLTLVLSLALATVARADAPACAGHDLISAMPAAERAALDAAVAAAPYPAGNHWRATRGDSTIDVIGTFHVYDPRMDAHIKTLMPMLKAADLILLEATPSEMDALQKAVASQPDLLFTTGATLPERLNKDDWQKVSDAMSARGIPGFFAAKFQPWYVAMMLSLPPCAVKAMGGGSTGLDRLIMGAAEDLHVPMQALEPYDTVFKVLATMPPEDQLDAIRQALPLTGRADDMLATVTASYDRQEHRQIWEFSRIQALDIAPDRPRAEADLERMEAGMVTARNRAWLPVILAAAPGKRLVVAVGAGHLSGDDGLLNLLARVGYRLDRAAF